MNVEIHCSKCGATLSVSAERGGDFISCPTCKHSVLIPLLPGKELGSYRIIRHLGTGGMGSVYLAEQMSMGRQVALKILAPELTRDERFRSRFEKEIRLQAALNHPNIAIAYDAGHDGPLYYLAMEYLEGHSLDEMIENNGPFSEKKALRIIQKVAVGLSYAWKTASLIHRDIKPSNIMLDDQEKVKVLDMGVSKSLKNKQGDEDSSQLIVGTPRYMPPEQMRGDENVDHRADIYALGATLYHMLTGQAPFPFQSVVKVVEAQAAGPAPSPQDLNPNISAACVHLIRVMMAENPESRYPYWSSLIADISRVLSGKKPMTALPGKQESLVAPSSGKLPEKQVKINPEELKKKSRRTESFKSQNVINGGVFFLVGMLVLTLAGVMMFVIDSNRPPSTKPDPLPAVTEPVPSVGEAVSAPEGAQPAKPAKTVKQSESPGKASSGPETPKESAQLQDLYTFITNRMAKLPESYSDHEEAVKRLKEDAESSGFGRYVLLARELEKKLAARKGDAKTALMANLEAEAERFWNEGKYIQSSRVWTAYHGALAEETQEARVARSREYDQKNQQRIQLQKESDLQARNVFEGLADLAAEEILAGDNLNQVLTALDEAVQNCLDAELRDRMLHVASCVKEVQHMQARILDQYREDVGRVVSLKTTRGVIPVQILDITNGYLYVERQLEQGSLGMVFKPDDLSLSEKMYRLAKMSDLCRDLRMAVLALREGDVQSALDSLENDETVMGQKLRLKIKNKTASSEPAGNEKQSNDVEALQIKRLKQALSAMNPGYQGDGEFRLDNGQIIAVNLQAAEGGIQNLDPLRGLPLKYLSVSGVAIQDLGPLRGMPLETALILNTEVDNLLPLQDMQLSRLSLQGSRRISDISVLEGMPLEALDLRGTQVRSLRSVQNAPLTSLMLSETFKTTSEFEHFPLVHLDISGSRITSLEGLTNMPLQSLYLVDVPVHDLKPLAGLPLEQIRFLPQSIHAGLKELREISSLKKLADSLEGDYLPADVFWGRYDRGFNDDIQPAEDD